MSTQAQTPSALREAWQDLLSQAPKTRIRDAATQLGVAEAELLATQIGEGVTRLAGDWEALLKEVPALGKVMALTRNEYVVIEKTGEFAAPEFFSHGGPAVGQVVAPEIDLRLFMHAWHYGFAVTKTIGGKTQYSLQFFDAQGTAVHKIYLRDTNQLERYHELVAAYQATAQPAELQLAAPEPNGPTAAMPDVDAEAFRRAWGAMTNTHEFFHLLRAYGLTRRQAFQLARGHYVWPAANGALQSALAQARDQALPIMAFAGNPGCLQIHTGPVQKLVPMENWYNVMDPAFNLHVHLDGIAEVFVVAKPTDDGPVTSLEFLDACGKTLLQLFGERKPGRAERPEWRAITDSLRSA